MHLALAETTIVHEFCLPGKVRRRFALASWIFMPISGPAQTVHWVRESLEE